MSYSTTQFLKFFRIITQAIKYMNNYYSTIRNGTMGFFELRFTLHDSRY